MPLHVADHFFREESTVLLIVPEGAEEVGQVLFLFFL